MRIGRTRVAVCLGLIGAMWTGCGAVGPYTTPATHTSRPSRRLILPSGLTVLAEQDPSATVAGVVWRVRCGSAQDPVGGEGLAHAVEHLVFRAPAQTGTAKYERLLRLGAADLNGETGFDATTYHTFVHQGAADALLALELASMADPLAGIDQQSFALEMGVVREESNFHDLPDEKRKGEQALERAVFPARHPYARPVGGSETSLNAITLVDARAFARSCYQPRNMVLVVSGPISPGWPDTFVAKLPAALRGDPAHPLAPRLPPAPALGSYPSPTQAVTRLTAPVTTPEIWVGWPLPPAVGSDAIAREVLHHLVTAVIDSGLDEEGDADNPQLESGRISVSITSGQLGGLLACRAQLPAGQSPGREADAIIEHVTSLWLLLNENQSWFERVRAHATASVARDASDVIHRSRAAAFLLASETSAQPDDIVKRVAAVSLAEALGWTRNYLRRDQARVVILKPSETPAPAVTPGVWSLHGAATLPRTASLVPGQRITDVAQPLGASRAVTRRLPNGLTVTLLRRPGAPLTDLILGFHASPAGPDDAALRAAFLAAREVHYFRRPAGIDIWHQVHSDRDSLRDDLEILAGHEDEALVYLGRVVGALSIEWPSDKFQRWSTVRRPEEDLPVPRAERAFWGALWSGQPYGAFPLVSDIERVEARAIESWVARVRRPGNGALIVVGDIDPDHFFQRVEATMGGWGKGDAIPNPAPASPPLRTEGTLRVIAQPVTGRPAAMVRLGCLMPSISDEGQRTVNRLLVRFLNDELRENLRQQAGASYAPHVTASGYRGGGDALEAWTDVQTSGLGLAVETLKKFADRDAPVPFDGATLERLRWAEARESNLRYLTSRDQARALFVRWNLGWPLSTLDELPTRLAAVTLVDLETALRTCRANAVLTVIGDTRALPAPEK